MTFAIVATFAVMEGLFVYFMITKVPKGDTWYRLRDKRASGYMTKIDKTIIASVVVAAAGIVLLAFILLPFNLPTSFVISTIFLPILIPGFFIWMEEKKIERRDSVFSAFIRALGRSSDVSGQTMTEAVKKLSMHKFGPLTKLIDNLAKRLNTRINTIQAWRHFSSESSSNLINKFGDMYIHSTLNGSKPEPTSIFVSNNMGRVLGVRKKRHVLASSFVGVLYGVMVSLSFTLWATIGIVQYISNMLGSLVASSNDLISGGFMGNVFSASFDIQLMTMMVYSVILIHAFFSSLMLSILRGGHTASAAIHFVAMIWIGTVSSFLVQMLMSGMLAP
jgi:flagellar protein FlaJ